MEALPEHHDPYLILWTLSRLVDPTALPQRRVVVRFDLPQACMPHRFWLVVGRDGGEVCVTPPGFGEDAVVTTDATWLYRWHSGHV